MFKHAELKVELESVLSKTVSKEMSGYCQSDSALKHGSADELSSFHNRVVVYEAKVFCPIWYACASGACDAHKSEEKRQKAINPLALVTAVMAKHRNRLMSAFAKRVSTILLHSGAKSQDFTRLNHLGLCTSHKQTIREQFEMGKNYDSKVLRWKREIEQNNGVLLLLQEILKNQSPTFDDDDMEIEIAFDLSQATLEKYKGYSSETFRQLAGVLEKEVGPNWNEDNVLIDDIERVQAVFQGVKPRSYR